MNHDKVVYIWTLSLTLQLAVIDLFVGGMASKLAAAIYVAMVTPILYDNSYSPNDSNLKDEIYWPYQPNISVASCNYIDDDG